MRRDLSEQPAPTVVKTDAEWRAQLSAEEYAVLRKAATERAFAGVYTDSHRVGLYRCRGCGSELFRSDAKFDSYCGWPSFFTPLAADRIIERADNTMFSRRTEVICASCHGHLGHVFSGEGFGTPTDLRYCINSISMTFDEDEPTV
jgi:peptide-methionine (R)-S-oxide reductase